MIKKLDPVYRYSSNLSYKAVIEECFARRAYDTGVVPSRIENRRFLLVEKKRSDRAGHLRRKKKAARV